MRTELDLTRRPEKPATKTSLAGLSMPALRRALEAMGIPEKKAKMRAAQIRGWAHAFGVTSFDDMTNVSKDLRAKLAEQFTLDRPKISEHLVSVDGTQKWLTEFAPGVEGESVFIPAVAKSGALCVSSQVGCTLNCTCLLYTSPSPRD